jgi:hypothetical protein
MGSHAALQWWFWITSNISYVLDLIELLINGWPEDGLLQAETCSHPNSVFNIILELGLTDYCVDIPKVQHRQQSPINAQNSEESIFPSHVTPRFHEMLLKISHLTQSNDLVLLTQIRPLASP